MGLRENSILDSLQPSKHAGPADIGINEPPYPGKEVDLWSPSREGGMS